NNNANVVAHCTVCRNPIRAQGATSLLARACWLRSAPNSRRLANDIAIDRGAGETAIRILLVRAAKRPTNPRMKMPSASICTQINTAAAMQEVTVVLLFAGCAPSRRCLYYRYEFVNYCSLFPAASYR